MTSQSPVETAISAVLRASRPLAAPSAARNPKDGSVAAASFIGRIAVIDERVLARDLLKGGLEAVGGVEVVTAASVEEWLGRHRDEPVALVVLCLPAGRPALETQQKLGSLIASTAGTPVVVMADVNDDVDYVTWILEQGARGYIATDQSLDVAYQAMRLVWAGGTYVPASCLNGARRSARMLPKAEPASQMFTARQAAVVEALRRGKANKTIAYELNMRESTVKVHVRNIMKKLKAKNRTEVAYMTSDLAKSGRGE